MDDSIPIGRSCKYSSFDETSAEFVLRFTDFGDVIMTIRQKYLGNI